MGFRLVGIRAGVLTAGLLLLLAFPAVTFGATVTADAPGVRRDSAASAGTVAQATCPSPRPPVRVNVQAVGDGQLRVTVTAGFGTLFVIVFGTVQNGHVVIPGSSQVGTGNTEVPLPPGTTSWTFTVVADPGASAATVPLTVYDGCREQPWHTFVGGGIDALVSAVTIDDARIVEGNTGTGTVTLPVSLSLPSQQPVTVAYATNNGAASAPADFVGASGVITFNPGETRKTISLQINGDFDAEGDETFTVTLSNPSNAVLRRGVATVTIVDDDTAPTASGDAYQATGGQTLSVAAGAGLLANDQPGSQRMQIVSFGGLDAGGDVTSFAAGTAATPPLGGSLLVRADGSFTYTPAPGFAGRFSFRYRAGGLSGQSDATVIVTVVGIPVANDDPGYVVTIPVDLHVAAPGLLGNDSLGTPAGSIVQFGGLDAGGTLGTSSATQAGSVRDLGDGGRLKVNGDGSFDFTTPSTVSGPFSFQYRLQSGIGADDATVTINVRRAPIVATTGGATTFTEGGGAVVVDPGLTVAYPGGTNLTAATVTIVNPADVGQETLSASPGASGITVGYAAPTLTLTGGAAVAAYEQVLRTVSFNDASATPSTAVRTIQFQVVSGAQSSNQATKSVTVTAVDTAPVAVNDSRTVAEDSAATALGVLANDTDLDGGSKVIVSATQPANGTVAIIGGADLTYQPHGTYCNQPGGAADTFRYTLNGGSTATVSVAVTCVDDPPVAVNDSVTVVEDGGATALAVLANDTDPDGGPKSIASVTQPANGAVAITGGGTGLNYAPSVDYCNSPPGTTRDTFTYSLAPGGSTGTVAVTVTCVDDPPVAVNDSRTVTEDSSATQLWVLANDTDVDGGPMAITSTTQPPNGTVAIINSGADLTYEPRASYCNQLSGTADTFRYTLNGGSTATVSVTVTCVAHAPVVSTTSGTTVFTQNCDAVIVDDGVTVTDADSTTLAWATIAITNVKNGSAEWLDVDLTGLSGISRSMSWDHGVFTLTLTGPASLATFQAALQRVTYYNNSADLNRADRIIQFQVNDGVVDSNQADKVVRIRNGPCSSAVNQLPRNAKSRFEDNVRLAIRNGPVAGLWDVGGWMRVGWYSSVFQSV